MSGRNGGDVEHDGAYSVAFCGCMRLNHGVTLVGNRRYPKLVVNGDRARDTVIAATMVGTELESAIDGTSVVNTPRCRGSAARLPVQSDGRQAHH